MIILVEFIRHQWISLRKCKYKRAIEKAKEKKRREKKKTKELLKQKQREEAERLQRKWQLEEEKKHRTEAAADIVLSVIPEENEHVTATVQPDQ